MSQAPRDLKPRACCFFLNRKLAGLLFLEEKGRGLKGLTGSWVGLTTPSNVGEHRPPRLLGADTGQGQCREQRRPHFTTATSLPKTSPAWVPSGSVWGHHSPFSALALAPHLL